LARPPPSYSEWLATLGTRRLRQFEQFDHRSYALGGLDNQ
jgi:hypothetical protein